MQLYLILSQMSKSSNFNIKTSWRESESDSKLISPSNTSKYMNLDVYLWIDHYVNWYQLLHQCGRALFMNYLDCENFVLLLTGYITWRWSWSTPGPRPPDTRRCPEAHGSGCEPSPRQPPPPAACQSARPACCLARKSVFKYLN